jgi:hypothetical protein
MHPGLLHRGHPSSGATRQGHEIAEADPPSRQQPEQATIDLVESAELPALGALATLGERHIDLALTEHLEQTRHGGWHILAVGIHDDDGIGTIARRDMHQAGRNGALMPEIAGEMHDLAIEASRRNI